MSIFRVVKDGLGRYERQAYLNVSNRLTGKKKAEALAKKEQDFRDLILRAYHAEPLNGGVMSSREPQWERSGHGRALKSNTPSQMATVNTD